VRQTRPTLLEVLVKSAITHTVTYFIMGLLAFTVLDYARFFAESELNVMMRPTTDRWVMAGPLFQPLRGILFGGVFYLLYDSVFQKKRGWLVMWITLIVLGIFGTFGPSPGSLEGMLYTVFPMRVHLRGLPEVLLQSLSLSVILVYWVNHPQRWLNWVLGIAFLVLMSLPILGMLATPRA
jgi:hypothetical protein